MDTSDLPSSQDTNEDPTLPGSEAAEATIILTPENAEARLAFSEVADWLQEQSEAPGIREAQDHARQYMWISPNQRRDAEVVRLARRIQTGDLSSSSPMSSPQRRPSSRHANEPPDPDLEYWNGVYYLALGRPPRQRLRGWTAGKVRHGQNLNDLVLCGRSANAAVYSVPGHQAILQIHSTGYVYIQTTSDRAYTYVNGTRVSGQLHVLNEASMTVTFGALRYRAEYTRFARSEDYRNRLYQYLRDNLRVQTSQSVLALTPTPSEASNIKVGQWTLTTGTIGSGASGRVSVGANSTGKVVALKRMTVGRDRTSVHRLREKLEMLASLAESHDENRLLRLVEMITDDAQGANRTADLWFILEPAVANTLLTTSVKGLLATGDERLSISRTLLVDILGATDFLHRNGWLHGDLKPDNVGIRTWSGPAKSVVLLDLDGIQKCPLPGRQHPAQPGTGGTIGWLSPEREMTGYTEKTDVWSIGVMALWMIQGRHPWRATRNPWRPGRGSVEAQALFCAMYEEAVTGLNQVGNTALRQVVLGMIRHAYAEQRSQREERFSSREALELLSPEQDQQPNKRPKGS